MSMPFPIKSTIDARRSIRNYQMRAVDLTVLATIKDFARTMPVPFEHDVEIHFFQADPTTALYTVMKSPPDNIAFLAKNDLISMSEMGFVGEMLILYAQSKELATGWHGYYKLTELERLMPLQSPDQSEAVNMGFDDSEGDIEDRRVICLTPLGYQETEGLRLMDRIAEKVGHKRKELSELLENPADLTQLSDEVLYALDLGRKAPSALNAQIWRFGFEDDFQTITVAMSPEHHHFKWEHPNIDIGICACHVYLGLLDKGCGPTIKIGEEAGRVIWKLSI